MISTMVEGGDLGLEVVEELVATGHVLVGPGDVLGDVLHEEHRCPVDLLLMMIIVGALVMVLVMLARWTTTLIHPHGHLLLLDPHEQRTTIIAMYSCPSFQSFSSINFFSSAVLQSMR